MIGCSRGHQTLLLRSNPSDHWLILALYQPSPIGKLQVFAPGAGEIGAEFDIYCYHLAPRLIGHGFDRRHSKNSRVIHEKICASKALPTLRRKIIASLRTRKIDPCGKRALSGEIKFSGHLLDRLISMIGERHIGATVKEVVRSSSSDSSARSSQYQNLACKIVVSQLWVQPISFK